MDNHRAQKNPSTWDNFPKPPTDITERQRPNEGVDPLRVLTPKEANDLLFPTIHRKKPKLYLIGSLRNPRVTALAEYIRFEAPEFEVFDDWMAAGPEADDYWKEYERGRGHSYQEALDGYAAKHVFDFDKHHIDTSSHALLVLPAGKSGHIELTYAKYANGAKAAVLLDPEEDVRYDVMYRFFDRVLEDDNQVIDWLKGE